jgi:hypothetical protein
MHTNEYIELMLAISAEQSAQRNAANLCKGKFDADNMVCIATPPGDKK